MANFWRTSLRKIDLGNGPLVMAILNVTPDSFSDGGRFISVSDALHKAERIVAEGADIIDVGGESTRPGSRQVSIDEEIRRTLPVIEGIRERFNIPISVDTTKSEVARQAVDAGAEIINDISGLRFDERIADVASSSNTGLVLMHSRGKFEAMHQQPPVDDIFSLVEADFTRSIALAKARGVASEQIVLDVGIGFGKTQEQNLELLARLDKIVSEFGEYPMVVGTSRKSFIGKILDDAPPEGRLSGSLATAVLALSRGARIVRVHDVKETVSAVRVLTRIHAHWET